MPKYSDEIKKKAREMITGGMSKLATSLKMGIPYKTVVDWTLDMRMRRICPRHIVMRVRRLARSGFLKSEVSKMTGIPYATVVSYTRDIKSGRKNGIISGSAIKLLREIISRGYAFNNNDAVNRSNYKTLNKNFPIRKVKMHGTAIFFLEGMEKRAMEALLEKTGVKSVSYAKLGIMRTAFGINNLRKNKVMRDANPRKEVERI